MTITSTNRKGKNAREIPSLKTNRFLHESLLKSWDIEEL
jgi:hypothetical protein